MRKTLFAALGLALLALGGCTTMQGATSLFTAVATVNTEQPVTPAIRRQIHLAYQTLQTAAANYVELRQCRASEPAFPANTCYRRSVAVALQVADRRAGAAIAALDNWAVNNPRLDARAVIAAASEAVAQYRAVFATASITVAGL